MRYLLCNFEILIICMSPFVAVCRRRYAGARLRGPALANVEWALALEEGWEMRYTRLLEAGDGWAALHCFR